LLNMTGEPIDGRQAYEWGLVERVTPPGGHLDAALELARTLAERSPHSIAVLKELSEQTRNLPLEEGLRREAEGFIRCLASEDGAEGVAAFIEKREPQWTGR
jgi:enoyl-CoA hydratase